MSKRAARKQDKIIIDDAKGLEFSSEDELYKHFYTEISTLEKEFFSLRPKDDLLESEFDQYENNLGLLLESPDEVWEDKEILKGTTFHIFIKKFSGEEKDEDQDEELPLYHVAIVYLTDNIPSFVYLHFPTTSDGLVAKYRRGVQTYDRLSDKIPFGALDGDALNEGDDFARGLYYAMMKVRAETDIKEDRFKKYGHLREETIEQPDEIWRNNDSMGNILVSFVKEYPDEGEGGLHYVVVTVEDMPTNSHALLFSFPTLDEALVGRYRHGENLQAEEVVQEASH